MAERAENIDWFKQQAIAETQDWAPHKRRIHDWRSHVGENVRRLWKSISPEIRYAIALDAQWIADNEDYE